MNQSKVKTTKNLVSLAKGFPTKFYKAAEPIIHDVIALGINRETALNAARTRGRENSRQIVTEYVTAFLDYDEQRKYSSAKSFDEMIEPFRIGKGISVPVKPLINIIESGKILPIFSVGWATFPLDEWQMRLLMTIFEDAIFSLRDFKNSSGEFICFPKVGNRKNATRQPLLWKRGDFELFSKNDMRDILHMYIESLEDAKMILKDNPLDTTTTPPADDDILPLFPEL
jgi:hypothetical protein